MSKAITTISSKYGDLPMPKELTAIKENTYELGKIQVINMERGQENSVLFRVAGIVENFKDFAKKNEYSKSDDVQVFIGSMDKALDAAGLGRGDKALTRQ